MELYSVNDRIFDILNDSNNSHFRQYYINQNPQTRIKAAIDLPRQESVLVEYQFLKSIRPIGLKARRPLSLSKLVFNIIIRKTRLPLYRLVEKNIQSGPEMANYAKFNQLCIKELLSIFQTSHQTEYPVLQNKLELIGTQISNLADNAFMNFNENTIISQDLLNNTLVHFKESLEKGKVSINIDWQADFYSIVNKHSIETLAFLMINSLLAHSPQCSNVHIHVKKSKDGFACQVTCNQLLAKNPGKYRFFARLLHLVGGQLQYRSIDDLGVVFDIYIPFLIPYVSSRTKPQDEKAQNESLVLISAGEKTKKLIATNSGLRTSLVNIDYSADYRHVQSIVLEVGSNFKSELEKVLELWERLKQSDQCPNLIILNPTNLEIDLQQNGLTNYEPIQISVATKLKEFFEPEGRLIYLLLKPVVSNIFDVSKGIKHTGPTSLDNKFLNALKECIENNIDSHHLNVDFLTKELGLSRMSLHRRIKQITGMSTTEMIRSVRIERACILLMNDHYNVSEVCYMVGFNNLSYFSKIFKEIKGVNPKEYLSDKNVA